jgi:hypothetical protein
MYPYVNAPDDEDVRLVACAAAGLVIHAKATRTAYKAVMNVLFLFSIFMIFLLYSFSLVEYDSFLIIPYLFRI